MKTSELISLLVASFSVQLDACIARALGEDRNPNANDTISNKETTP